MADVDNDTGLPHFLFEQSAARGELFDVLVVRGTFDFAANDAPISFAREQAPIVYADEYDGPVETRPLAAVLEREGDLVVHKPSTDVHVTGTARPVGGRATTDWLASVTVGPVQKTLRLCGPRAFERRSGELSLTPPEPTDAVELDYRNAFGGAFEVSGSLLPEGEDVYVTKPDNPAGCGWLPDEEALSTMSREARPYVEAQVEALERIPAPRIEHPDEPILSPTQRAAAQGFGPVPRWWAPRVGYTGTLDERWRAEQYPCLPDDFDPRFYQSAHPDMISPSYLQGDERIALSGMLLDGPVTMRLPSRRILVGFIRQSGAQNGGRLELDTISLDLDRRQVSLVWRGAFHARDPVAVIAVRMVTLGGNSETEGAHAR